MSPTQDQTGDNRPPVYWEGDDLIIRASALGTSCLYELTAAGQGYQPATLPKSLLRAFSEGHALEPHVIKLLVDDYGLVFLSSQVEGMLKVDDGLYIRYHPDGIANLLSDFWFNTNYHRNLRCERTWGNGLPPRTVVVEIKALSDGLWQKFRAHGMASVIDEYPWQLSSMMLDQGMPGLWVGYNKGNSPDPETGVRAPCPDQGKLWFELQTMPPISVADINDKAEKIKELVCGEDILESGATCTDPTNWPCRYLHVRPEEGDRVEQRTTFMVSDGDNNEANDEIRGYLLFKGQADEAAKRAEFFKKRLMERAGDAEILETDTWQVPITNGANTSADWGQMAADGIEVETYKRRTTYRYINRKHIKRKDEDG